MASKNRLLGSGLPEVAEEVKQTPSASSRVPVWRYSTECPQGKVVKTDAELDRLDAAGWVDHPGKVSLLPGHENMFPDK